MSTTADIDKKLLNMSTSSEQHLGRIQADIMQLLIPIYSELKTARVISIEVRRGFMYLLLKEDIRKYNEELAKSGKCIWIDTI